jgi:hypothetical protein
MRKRLPKQEPFGCFEHEEKDAAVRACADTEFVYGEYKGSEGVLTTVVPTKLGAEHVNGGMHRSWSPSFATDADYSKAKEKGGVHTFPEGVRGSTGNPARITGIDFCFGTLTNKPAFHNMEPVKARQGGKLKDDPISALDKKIDDIFASFPKTKTETADEIFASLGKTGGPQPVTK